MKDLVERFQFEKVLGSSPENKTIALLGQIECKKAILSLEKLHFDELDPSKCYKNIEDIQILLHNDVYYTGVSSTAQEMKLTMIYPATEVHIRKFAEQKYHMVVETPEMYKQVVKPYIDEICATGRLQWVYNILYHGAESERVVHNDDDMMILPDLKWDGSNMANLYLVAIVKDKTIQSLRDLSKAHIPYLQRISDTIKQVLPEKYGGKIASDQLRVFVHYQPSYYHFHIHIVNIAYGGLGQGLSVGKAWLLDDIIEQLRYMPDDGFMSKTLNYVLGENHDLWKRFNSN